MLPYSKNAILLCHFIVTATVNIADGPRMGAHRDSRGLDGHVSMGHTIEDRLDEMMRMLSGTQQLLLDQQSTTKRLESSVEKLNADVDTLRSDLKVFDQDSCASGNEALKCETLCAHTYHIE